MSDTDAATLTAYFGERKRAGDRLVASALLELYGREEIAASVLLRGVEGFGVKHHLRTDSSLSLSEDLPAVAVAVDTRDRIEGVRERVIQLTHGGLVTVERAVLQTGDQLAAASPHGPDQMTKLTLYFGRQERVGRTPAFVAICDLFHRRGVAGASTLLGVDGTAHGQREQARFFARNAEVPVVVIAVGPGERITAALPDALAMLRRPIATFEQVRVCKRDGELIEAPHALDNSAADGDARHKLTVFTSESQLHGGRPIHRAIMQRLRVAGASGATTVRGIWGYHGDHPPHGDRTIQLGRHVPTVTTVIDTAERIARSFAIIDELTDEHGLVTSEVLAG